MNDLVVYRNGIVHCSVCVPADMGRIIKAFEFVPEEAVA